MKNFEQYNVEDFVLNKDFQDWVQGNSRNGDFWLAFVQQHPELSETIRLAELVIRAMQVQPNAVSDKIIREDINRFMNRAQAVSVETDQRTHYLKNWGNSLAYRAAAVISLLGLLFTAVWFYNSPKVANLSSPLSSYILPLASPAALAETVNSTNRPLRLVLSDNSLVILSPNSSLKYAPHFTTTERRVYLTGEAQFNVVKKTIPFKVYAGGLVTQVLGTSFVVRAYEQDAKATVQVRSGRVSVYKMNPISAQDETVPSNLDATAIILTPNQMAVYERADSRLLKSITAEPIVLQPEAIEFDFTETPLPAVLRQLERAYGIHFQFDEEALQGCQITASLSNETMYEKLTILCKLVGGSYEVVDGQVIIHAGNCR